MLHKILSTAVAIVLIVSGAAMAGLETSETKDIQVQQAFQTIQNPQPASDFNVSVWVDRQDNTYALGNNIIFYFKATQDCYIHLLDIGTSGKVSLIYPNQYEQKNFIKGGVVYQLPRQGSFNFTASGPAGREMVKAIVTKTQVNLMDLNQAQATGPFRTFDQTKSLSVAKDIQVTLNQVPTPTWAEYQKVITIVDNSGPQPVTGVQPPPAATNTPAAAVSSLPSSGYQAFRTQFWTDKPTYRIGEAVRFYFNTNRDAYVTLVSIGTSGKVRVLFPNRFAPQNFCKSGVTYTVPQAGAAEQYVAIAPAGTETLKLIAAQSQFSLSPTGYDFTTMAYPEIGKNAADVTKDIQVVATAQQQKPEGYYDEATITVQIAP